MHGKYHLSFRQLIDQKTPATAINKGASSRPPLYLSLWLFLAGFVTERTIVLGVDMQSGIGMVSDGN